MTRQEPEPAAERRAMPGDEARERLIEAAGRVFAEKGYRSATVREICARAGVNGASVNYYFGDKETLYFEAVRRARQLRAEQFPLPERPAGAPPELRLRDFVATMLWRTLAEEQASWNTQLMMREVMEPTQICRRLVEEYFRPQFEGLLGILREMLPAETPNHVCRKVGFSIVGQCMHYRVGRAVVALMTPEAEYRDHYQPEQLADHITRVALAAVGRSHGYGGGSGAVAGGEFGTAWYGSAGEPDRGGV